MFYLIVFKVTLLIFFDETWSVTCRLSMISIPLSFLSEKKSSIKSLSIGNRFAIKLSLKDKFKALVKCPYCGSHIRKYGFFKKECFNASDGTFTTYQIQRCQCANKFCPYIDLNDNKQRTTFSIYPRGFIPFTSIRTEDLDYVIAFALSIENTVPNSNLIDIEFCSEPSLVEQLKSKYDVASFEPKRRRLQNYTDNLISSSLSLYNAVLTTINQAKSVAVSYFDAYTEASSPHKRAKQNYSTSSCPFMSLLTELLNENVIKRSTCELIGNGHFFRKLTLPITWRVKKTRRCK